jgi:gliding motility-associated-like protein
MQKLTTLLLALTLSFTAAAQWQWATGCYHGAEGEDIALDRHGNIFAIGFTYGNMALFGADTIPVSRWGSGVGSQPIIAKYDPAGNIQWVRGLLNGVAAPVGVTTDGAGNSYFFGTFSGSVDVGTDSLVAPTGDIMYYLIKYDPAGNVKWMRSAGYHTFSSSFFDKYGGVAADSFGNVYITESFANSFTVGSTTLTSTGSQDVFIIKYDTLGNVIWAKQAGGANADYAGQITTTSSGTFYISGTFFSPSITFGSSTLTNPGSTRNCSMYIVKYDGTGNVLWAKNSGSDSEEVNGIVTNADKNVYATGRFPHSGTFGTASLSNPYRYPEIFVTKYDSTGNTVWAQGITTPSHVLAEITSYGITEDGCGNVWICGRMDSVLFLGSHTFLNTITPVIDEFFLAGYNSSGSVIGYTELKYGGDDLAGIAADTAGNIFVCSDYDYGPFTVGSTTIRDLVPGAYEDLYIAKYTTNISIATDTVHGTTFDTLICSGAAITLKAAPGHTNYLWNTGTTTPTYIAPDTGTYWVYATDPCVGMVTIDSFKLQHGGADLAFSLGDDTASCLPLTLRIPISGVAYLWQDGNTTNTETISHTGLYYATVNSNGCTYTDSIQVTVSTVTPVSLRDTTICRENLQPVILSVSEPADVHIEWSTGSTAQQISATDTGTYSVHVSYLTCSDSGTSHISSQICDCKIVMPTAFTPNNDNHNNYCHPVIETGCIPQHYLFMIFDRWGEAVFKTTDPAGKWDGKLKGVNAELGTYMYYIEYSTTTDPTRRLLKGDVQLIR